MIMKKNISKIKKIKESVLSQKKAIVEEASSNLLNFIIKSKREKSLKGKITIKPSKKPKKIIKAYKKIFKKPID